MTAHPPSILRPTVAHLLSFGAHSLCPREEGAPASSSVSMAFWVFRGECGVPPPPPPFVRRTHLLLRRYERRRRVKPKIRPLRALIRQ